jgi:hypothetical protein
MGTYKLAMFFDKTAKLYFDASPKIIIHKVACILGHQRTLHFHRLLTTIILKQMKYDFPVASSLDPLIAPTNLIIAWLMAAQINNLSYSQKSTDVVVSSA